MTGFVQDVLFALRQVRKNPWFAATAIVVMALGLGATTGMLAIVQSVLVRPLSYRGPDRLVLVGVSEQADSKSNVGYLDFEDLRRNLHQCEDLAAYVNMPLAVQTDDGTDMIVAPGVSTNFFDLLGVQPMLGRGFRAGDEALGSAVVSHEFWQHSMHGRQDVLGSKLKINSELYTVVGVMPPHFQFPPQVETLWTTLQLTPDHKTKQGFDEISVLGRLKPGVTLDQLRSEGEALLRHKADADHAKAHFWLYPYQKLVTGDEKPAILALFGACLLLLTIAVVNTANLQIARVTRRETEIAVRASLGATRIRILRQLVVESLVISAAGAGLGLLLASGFVQAARKLFSNYPRFDEVRLDGTTFLGCFLLTLLCGVAAALAPAWHVLRERRGLALQQNTGGRASRSHRLSGVLVAAEVALTSILLVAAGLFLRTFRSLQNVPLGFAPDHVTTFVLWPQGGNVALPVARASFQKTLDRLQATPGIEAAGMVTSLPISEFQLTITGGFNVPGHPFRNQKQSPEVKVLASTPGYLRAMRIPVLSGRPLSDDDKRGSQMVGVVNRRFVQEFLPDTNPLGGQIVFDKDAEFPEPVTIVGVAGDVVQNNSIGTPAQPEVYLSLQQLPETGVLPRFLYAVAASFAVRSSGNLPTAANDIRSVVKNEAPEFALDSLATMDERVEGALKTRRLAVQITSVFAWVALLLSAAGLYGVLAYLVGQRGHEIGIRLALGATRENVFGLVVRQGLWMVGAGLLFGTLGAWLAAHWISSLLYGATTHDPATYLLAGGLVLAASALAIAVPARRAAAVEPMVALRYE